MPAMRTFNVAFIVSLLSMERGLSRCAGRNSSLSPTPCGIAIPVGTTTTAFVDRDARAGPIQIRRKIAIYRALLRRMTQRLGFLTQLPRGCHPVRRGNRFLVASLIETALCVI